MLPSASADVRLQSVRHFRLKMAAIMLSTLTAFVQYCIAADNDVRTSSGMAMTSREYCVFERFTARCDADEVILIRNALYGRMQARRCITSDYINALGCYTDITGYIDSLCSGKQNCSVLVATIDSVAQPCAKDFKSYLEASFDCVRVSFADDCRHDNFTSLDAERGHVALYPRSWRSLNNIADHSDKRLLTSSTCPWLIEAEPGRKITLYWARIPHSSTHSTAVQQTTSTSVTGCHVIIEFRERLRNSNDLITTHEACTSHYDVTPTIPLYESRGSQVEVRVRFNLTGFYGGIHEPRHISNTGLLFLLRYVVHGCRDLQSPEGATVYRKGHSAVIVCNDTFDSWYVTCGRDGRWDGGVINCTTRQSPPAVVETQVTDMTSTAGYGASSEDDFTQGVLLAIAVGVALGMLIGGLLFVVLLMRNDSLLDPFSAAITCKKSVTSSTCTGLQTTVDVSRQHNKMAADCLYCRNDVIVTSHWNQRSHRSLLNDADWSAAVYQDGGEMSCKPEIQAVTETGDGTTTRLCDVNSYVVGGQDVGQECRQVHTTMSSFGF